MKWIWNSVIAMVAAGVLLTAGGCTDYYSRLEHSTHAFQKYFEVLKTSDVAVNPVERFMFSLVLANTKRSTDSVTVSRRGTT